MSSVRTWTPDDRTVVATVTVAGTPERVFRAFTDPAELAAWFWPERFATSYRLDVREGGEYVIRSDAMGMGVRGRYLEVTPPTRLAMSWRWDGEEGETHVLVELAAEGDGTLVTVTHGANPSSATRDGHAQGWRDCLDRLASGARGAGRRSPAGAQVE
ncbi:MAG TPA: SRPBCC domain-containing protein [Pseudonocardiaceae bacterium]